MEIVAIIKNDYKVKFGIPRQSGIVKNIISQVIFQGKYRDREYIRGIEQFTHLWLIWGFSQNEKKKITATVRPPKLGGNVRKGVFATRSPYRPNGLGLSSVKLLKVENGVLFIAGADLMDGTPIYDIKPYIPYSDCHVDATGGFTDRIEYKKLEVIFDTDVSFVDKDTLHNLKDVLANDPRPQYREDEGIYSFEFSKYNIKFYVKNDIVTVTEIKLSHY